MAIFSPGIPTSGEALENFLRHNVSNAIWETYSGNQLIADLRAAGAAISESKFFSIRGDVLGFQRFFAPLARLDEDTRVPHSNYIQNHNWQLSQKFLYGFRLDVTNNRTGERFLVNRSITADRERTVGELREELTNMLEEVTQDTSLTAHGGKLRFALVAPGVFEST